MFLFHWLKREGYNILEEPWTWSLAKSRNRETESRKVQPDQTSLQINVTIKLPINHWKLNCNQHFFPSKSSPAGAAWATQCPFHSAVLRCISFSLRGDMMVTEWCIYLNELSVTLWWVWMIGICITITLTVALIWPHDYSGDVLSSRSGKNPSFCFCR